MKVIFLDIDGVLNSSKTKVTTSWSGYTFVSAYLINNLKQIIDATDAKVVLSSDWRYNRDNPEFNQDFLELKEKLEQFGIRFYDYTPEILRGVHRGVEIQDWINNHKEVEQFVILDDRSDMEPNMDHLVRTHPKDGLTMHNVEQAIDILNSYNHEYAVLKSVKWKETECLGKCFSQYEAFCLMETSYEHMVHELCKEPMQYLSSISENSAYIIPFMAEDKSIEIHYDIVAIPSKNKSLYQDITALQKKIAREKWK